VLNINTSFNMKAIQILEKYGKSLLWNIDKIWTSSITDAAFLRLRPMSEECQNHEWRLPRLSLLPPPVGSEVHCFGYPHSKATLTDTNGNSVSIRLEQSPTTSKGTVIAVFNERRDSFQFPFACFQTDARFDGGMSGGPVFSGGYLCG
jgi:Trypsin-like peptidase domain